MFEISCSKGIPYHELEEVKIKNSFVNSRNHYDTSCNNRKFTTWNIEDMLLEIKFSIHGYSPML